MTFTSLYIHIPFCIHRCGYCDFNTYAGLEELLPVYTKALCKELVYLASSVSEALPIHTIYFGGGTPSLVPSEGIKHILAIVRQHFDLLPSAEVTLEANPGTVSADYFYQIRNMGVNRISLGIQSVHEDELKLLERQHTYQEVVTAVEWARDAGITNLNLDLIFGLPDQRMNSWMDSLVTALSLQPEHLSLYALTLEHGTPLQHKIADGILPEPDSDLAAAMYEAARERLEESGFSHYEISNWARVSEPGKATACLHNLQYWRTLPYIGVGAGAHGFVNHYRTVNVATPELYINRLMQDSALRSSADEFPRTPATIQMNYIDNETEIGEMMMMGLRLIIEGVSNLNFEKRYGMCLQDKFGPQIKRLISFGLLEWIGSGDERLRLTKKGHLLGNQVFKEFI